MAHRIGATLALVCVVIGAVFWVLDVGGCRSSSDFSWFWFFKAPLSAYIFFRIVGGILGWIWKPKLTLSRDFTYRRVD